MAPIENHWSRDIVVAGTVKSPLERKMRRVASITLASKWQNRQRFQGGLAGDTPVTGRNLIRLLFVL